MGPSSLRAVARPVETRIREKLTRMLQPQHLEVINESSAHAVPKGSETHFRVLVVSSLFGGERGVARHRRVYEVLGDELSAGVHALAIEARTPDEWAGGGPIGRSPPCLGGGRVATAGSGDGYLVKGMSGVTQDE
uniref:BolA-like protein 1 n=1 Tax=Eptatretus burgeri TaxID=7764 RepID=A0A8C4Q5B0_EPTBU